MYFHPFASKRDMFSRTDGSFALSNHGFSAFDVCRWDDDVFDDRDGTRFTSRAEQVGSSRRIASRSHPAKSVIRSPSDRKIRLREREREQFRPLTVIVLATKCV